MLFPFEYVSSFLVILIVNNVDIAVTVAIEEKQQIKNDLNYKHVQRKTIFNFVNQIIMMPDIEMLTATTASATSPCVNSPRWWPSDNKVTGINEYLSCTKYAAKTTVMQLLAILWIGEHYSITMTSFSVFNFFFDYKKINDFLNEIAFEQQHFLYDFIVQYYNLAFQTTHVVRVNFTYE